MADINFDVGFIVDKNQLSNFDQEIERTFDKIQNGIMTSLNSGSKKGSEYSLKQLKDFSSKSKKMFQDMSNYFDMFNINKGDIQKYLNTYKRVMQRAKAIADGQNIGSSFKAEMNQLNSMMKSFQSVSKTSLRAVQDDVNKMVKHINDSINKRRNPLQLDKGESQRYEKYYKEFLNTLDNETKQSYNKRKNQAANYVTQSIQRLNKLKEKQTDLLNQSTTLTKTQYKERSARLEHSIKEERKILKQNEKNHEKILNEQLKDFRDYLENKKRLSRQAQKGITLAGSQTGMVKSTTDFREELTKTESVVTRIKNKVKGMFASFKDRGAIRSLVDIKAGFEMVYHSIMTVVRGIKAVLENTTQLQSGARLAGTLIDNYTLKAIGGFEKLESITKNISYQFGTEIPTATSAMYKALTSGAPAENLEKVLEVGNKLAVGGRANFDVVLDGMTSLVNAFGDLDYSMSSLTRVSDSMFTSMKYGKFTLEELSNNLGKVSTLTSNMGLSLEETLSSLAAITRTGLHIDESATQMRGALKKLLDPSAQARDIMQELGIAWGANALEGRPFIEVLIEIREKLENAGYTLSDVFEDIRGLQGIMSLTNNTMETYNTLTADMARANKNLGIATENAFNKNIDTLERWNKRATAAWNTFLADFGSSTLEPLAKSWDKFIYNTFGSAEQKLKVAQDKIKGYTLQYQTLSKTLGKDGGLITEDVINNSSELEETIKSIALVSPKLAKDFEYMAEQVREGNMELETMRDYFINIGEISFKKTLSNIPKITKTLAETIGSSVGDDTLGFLEDQFKFTQLQDFITKLKEARGDLSSKEITDIINDKSATRYVEVTSRMRKLYNDFFSEMDTDAQGVLDTITSHISQATNTVSSIVTKSLQDTAKTVQSIAMGNKQVQTATLKNLKKSLQENTQENKALLNTLDKLGYSTDNYVNSIKYQIEVNKELSAIQEKSSAEQINDITKIIERLYTEAESYKDIEMVVSRLNNVMDGHYDNIITNETKAIEALQFRIKEHHRMINILQTQGFEEGFITSSLQDINFNAMIAELLDDLEKNNIDIKDIIGVEGSLVDLIKSDPDKILKKLENALREATQEISEGDLPFGIDVGALLSDKKPDDESLAMDFLFSAEDLSNNLNNALANVEIDENKIEELYSILKPKEDIFGTIKTDLNSFVADTEEMTSKISQVLAVDTDFKGFNFIKEDMIPIINRMVSLQGQMGDGVLNKIIGSIPDTNEYKELFSLINDEIANGNLGAGYEDVLKEKYKAIEQSLIEEAKATITNQKELNNRIRIIRKDTETAITEMVTKNADQRISYVITKYLELNQQRQKLSQEIQNNINNEAQLLAIIKSIRDNENLSIDEKLLRLDMVNQKLRNEYTLQQAINRLADEYGQKMAKAMALRAQSLTGIQTDLSKMSGAEKAEFKGLEKEYGREKALEIMGLTTKKDEDTIKPVTDKIEETKEQLTASLSAIEKTNEEVSKNTTVSADADEDRKKEKQKQEYNLDLSSIYDSDYVHSGYKYGHELGSLKDEKFQVEYDDYIEQMVNFRESTEKQFKQALLSMGLEKISKSSYESISDWKADVEGMYNEAKEKSEDFLTGLGETMDENIKKTEEAINDLSGELNDNINTFQDDTFKALMKLSGKTAKEINQTLGGTTWIESFNKFIRESDEEKYIDRVREAVGDLGEALGADLGAIQEDIVRAYNTMYKKGEELYDLQNEKWMLEGLKDQGKTYAFIKEKGRDGEEERNQLNFDKFKDILTDTDFTDSEVQKIGELQYGGGDTIKKYLADSGHGLSKTTIKNNLFGNLSDWEDAPKEALQAIYDILKEKGYEIVTMGEIINERILKTLEEGILKTITSKNNEIRSKFKDLPDDLFNITADGKNPLEPLLNKIKNTGDAISESLYVVTQELQEFVDKEAGETKLDLKPLNYFSDITSYMQYIISLGKDYKDAMDVSTNYMQDMINLGKDYKDGMDVSDTIKDNKNEMIKFRQAYMESIVEQDSITEDYTNKMVEAEKARLLTLKDIEKMEDDPVQSQLLDREITIDLDKDGIAETTTTLREVLIREADATVAKVEENYQKEIIKLHKEFNENYRNLMVERLEEEDPMSQALLNMQKTIAEIEAKGEFQETFNQLFEITKITQDKLKNALKDIIPDEETLNETVANITHSPEKAKEYLKTLEDSGISNDAYKAIEKIVLKLMNLREQEDELTEIQNKKQENLLLEMRTNMKILSLKQDIAKANFKLINGEQQLVKQSQFLIQQSMQQLEYLRERYEGNLDIYDLAMKSSSNLQNDHEKLKGLSEEELNFIKEIQSIMSNVYDLRRKILQAKMQEHDENIKIASAMADESELAKSLITTFGSIAKLATASDHIIAGSQRHKDLRDKKEDAQKTYDRLKSKKTLGTLTDEEMKDLENAEDTIDTIDKMLNEGVVTQEELKDLWLDTTQAIRQFKDILLTVIDKTGDIDLGDLTSQLYDLAQGVVSTIPGGEIAALVMEVAKMAYEIFMKFWQSAGYQIAEQAKQEAMQQEHNLQLLQDKNELLEYAISLNLENVNSIAEQRKEYAKLLEEYKELYNIETNEDAMGMMEGATNQATQAQQALDELRTVDWGAWFDDTDDKWWDKYSDILGEMGFNKEDFKWGKYTKEAIMEALNAYISAQDTTKEAAQDYAGLMDSLRDSLKEQLETEAELRGRLNELRGNNRKALENEMDLIDRKLELSEELGLTEEEQAELLLDRIDLLKELKDLEQDRLEAQQELVLTRAGLQGLEDYNQLQLQLAATQDLITAKAYELERAQEAGLGTDILIELEQEYLNLKKEERDLQDKILDAMHGQYEYQSKYVSANASLIEKKAKLAGYDEEEIEELKLQLIQEQITAKQEELNSLDKAIAEKRQLNIDTKDEILSRLSLEESIIDLQLQRTDIQKEQLETQEKQNEEMEKGNALYDKQLRSHLRAIIRARQVQDEGAEEENVWKAAKRMRDLGVSSDDIYRMLGVDIQPAVEEEETENETIDTNINTGTGIIGGEPTDMGETETEEDLPDIQDLLDSIDEWITSLEETGDEDTFIEDNLPSYLEGFQDDLAKIREYLGIMAGVDDEDDGALIEGEEMGGGEEDDDLITDDPITDSPIIDNPIIEIPDNLTTFGTPGGNNTYNTPGTIFNNPTSIPQTLSDSQTIGLLSSINRNISNISNQDSTNNIGININNDEVKSSSSSDTIRNNVYYDRTMRG